MANKYDQFSEEELIEKLNNGFNGPEDLAELVSAMQKMGMSGQITEVDENDPLAVKVSSEYIDSHKKMRNDKPSTREAKEAIKLLSRKDIQTDKLKEIILILAHSGNIKALRALEKLFKKSEGELKKWCKMAIGECKMFIESSLLDRPSIKIQGDNAPREPEPSIIGRLFEFLFDDQDEAQRAIDEFFDGVGTQNKVLPFINEYEENLFMDWLIFDYRLSGGKKLIQTFLEKFAENLPKGDREQYEEMQFNKYGLFEVKAIKREKWIDLESISSLKVYRVKEKLGTRGSTVGRVLLGRLGKQDGDWKMIGSNPIEVPLHLKKGAKEFFSKIKDLTPKDFRSLAKKMK